MSEWDSDAVRAYWQVAEVDWYRYFVTVGTEPEKEVDVTEWRAYERRAGFIPKFRGTNATGGFAGWAGEDERVRISGRMVWNGPADSG